MLEFTRYNWIRVAFASPRPSSGKAYAAFAWCLLASGRSSGWLRTLKNDPVQEARKQPKEARCFLPELLTGNCWRQRDTARSKPGPCTNHCCAVCLSSHCRKDRPSPGQFGISLAPGFPQHRITMLQASPDRSSNMVKPTQAVRRGGCWFSTVASKPQPPIFSAHLCRNSRRAAMPATHRLCAPISEGGGSCPAQVSAKIS